MNIDEFLAVIVPIISSNIATIIGCIVAIYKAIKGIKSSTDDNTRELRKQSKALMEKNSALERENRELRRLFLLESHKRLNIKEAEKDEIYKES